MSNIENAVKLRSECGDCQTRQSTADRAMEHRCYRSFDEVSEFYGVWDDLAIAEADFYSSFDFCKLWWQYYGRGRKLEIHVFARGCRLLGVVPLFREFIRLGPFRVRVVRIVGCDHSTTTCGLPIRREHAEEVIPLLVNAIAAEPWDLVHLGRLPDYCASIRPIVRHFAEHSDAGSIHQVCDNSPQTLIDLPNSIEEYGRGLSRREQQNIRKENRRLLAEHNLEFDEPTLADGPASGFEQFTALHQSEWTRKGHRGHFQDWPSALEFHRDLVAVQAAAGRLVLRRARADGQPLAMAYAYRFGARLHWFLAARSMDSRWHFCFPGRVGAYDLIRMAIENGLKQIDLGLGYYPYKLKLGGRLLPVTHIYAAHKGFLPKLKVGLLRSEALLHEIVGYRLWYKRLALCAPWSRTSMNDRWIRLRMWPSDCALLGGRLKSICTSPGSLLTRLRQRGRGMGGAAGMITIGRTIMCRWFHRHHLVYALEPGGADETGEDETAGLTVRRVRVPCELGDEERAVLLEQGGQLLHLKLQDHLLRGSELWLAYLNDKVAGACWSERPERVGRYYVPLGNGDIVIRKCFTLTRFQGGGVYTSTLHYMVAALAADGYRRILIDSSAWNDAARRGIKKAGFKELGTVVNAIKRNHVCP